MAVTAADGRAVWVFAVPLAAAPVVAALPLDAAPGGATALTVVLEEVTAQRVAVPVWRTRPVTQLGQTPLVPAGEGISVHLTATEGAVPLG
ncbi:hypothetical protein AB0A98_38295 [Streptomyces chrestomyceticus]|uniref:hypothetical protein n=1 Tax=Streptomyces chrestomyceticus TaxID=68185 RepID=UPI0033F515EB